MAQAEQLKTFDVDVKGLQIDELKKALKSEFFDDKEEVSLLIEDLDKNKNMELKGAMETELTEWYTTLMENGQSNCDLEDIKILQLYVNIVLDKPMPVDGKINDKMVELLGLDFETVDMKSVYELGSDENYLENIKEIIGIDDDIVLKKYVSKIKEEDIAAIDEFAIYEYFESFTLIDIQDDNEKKIYLANNLKMLLYDAINLPEEKKRTNKLDVIAKDVALENEAKNLCNSMMTNNEFLSGNFDFLNSNKDPYVLSRALVYLKYGGNDYSYIYQSRSPDSVSVRTLEAKYNTLIETADNMKDGDQNGIYLTIFLEYIQFQGKGLWAEGRENNYILDKQYINMEGGDDNMLLQDKIKNSPNMLTILLHMEIGKNILKTSKDFYENVNKTSLQNVFDVYNGALQMKNMLEQGGWNSQGEYTPSNVGETQDNIHLLNLAEKNKSFNTWREMQSRCVFTNSLARKAGKLGTPLTNEQLKAKDATEKADREILQKNKKEYIRLIGLLNDKLLGKENTTTDIARIIDAMDIIDPEKESLRWLALDNDRLCNFYQMLSGEKFDGTLQYEAETIKKKQNDILFSKLLLDRWYNDKEINPGIFAAVYGNNNGINSEKEIHTFFRWNRVGKNGSDVTVGHIELINGRVDTSTITEETIKVAEECIKEEEMVLADYYATTLLPIMNIVDINISSFKNNLSYVQQKNLLAIELLGRNDELHINLTEFKKVASDIAGGINYVENAMQLEPLTGINIPGTSDALMRALDNIVPDEISGTPLDLLPVDFTGVDGTMYGALTKMYSEEFVNGLKKIYPTATPTKEQFAEVCPQDWDLSNWPIVMSPMSAIFGIPYTLDFNNYPNGDVVVSQGGTIEELGQKWKNGEYWKFTKDVLAVVAGAAATALPCLKGANWLIKGLVFYAGQKYAATGFNYADMLFDGKDDGNIFNFLGRGAGKAFNIYETDGTGKIKETNGERTIKPVENIIAENVLEYTMGAILFTKGWGNLSNRAAKGLQRPVINAISDSAISTFQAKFFMSAASLASEAALFTVLGAITTPLTEGVMKMINTKGDREASLKEMSETAVNMIQPENMVDSFLHTCVFIGTLRGTTSALHKLPINKKYTEKQQKLVEENNANLEEMSKKMKKSGIESEIIDGKVKFYKKGSTGESVEIKMEKENPEIYRMWQKTIKMGIEIQGLQDRIMKNSEGLKDHEYLKFCEKNMLNSGIETPEKIIQERIDGLRKRGKEFEAQQREKKLTELKTLKSDFYAQAGELGLLEGTAEYNNKMDEVMSRNSYLLDEAVIGANKVEGKGKEKEIKETEKTGEVKIMKNDQGNNIEKIEGDGLVIEKNGWFVVTDKCQQVINTDGGSVFGLKIREGNTEYIVAKDFLGESNELYITHKIVFDADGKVKKIVGRKGMLESYDWNQRQGVLSGYGIGGGNEVVKLEVDGFEYAVPSKLSETITSPGRKYNEKGEIVAIKGKNLITEYKINPELQDIISKEVVNNELRIVEGKKEYVVMKDQKTNERGVEYIDYRNTNDIRNPYTGKEIVWINEITKNTPIEFVEVSEFSPNFKKGVIEYKVDKHQNVFIDVGKATGESLNIVKDKFIQKIEGKYYFYTIHIGGRQVLNTGVQSNSPSIGSNNSSEKPHVRYTPTEVEANFNLSNTDRVTKVEEKIGENLSPEQMNVLNTAHNRGSEYFDATGTKYGTTPEGSKKYYPDNIIKEKASILRGNSMVVDGKLVTNENGKVFTDKQATEIVASGLSGGETKDQFMYKIEFDSKTDANVLATRERATKKVFDLGFDFAVATFTKEKGNFSPESAEVFMVSKDFASEKPVEIRFQDGSAEYGSRKNGKLEGEGRKVEKGMKGYGERFGVKESGKFENGILKEGNREFDNARSIDTGISNENGKFEDGKLKQGDRKLKDGTYENGIFENGQLVNGFKIQNGKHIDVNTNYIEANNQKDLPNEGNEIYIDLPASEVIGFENVKNFDELYAELDRAGDIVGSQKTYTPKELKTLIDKVRAGEHDNIKYITNTGGLRSKVEKLLELENSNSAEIKNEKGAEGFEKIKNSIINSTEGYEVGAFPEFIQKGIIVKGFLDAGFIPKNTIKIGNDALYLTDKILTSSGYSHILGYTNKGEVRFFYRSGSEGEWRSTPGSRIGDGALSKGEMIENFSYETTTKVDPKISQIMDSYPSVNMEKSPVRVSGEILSENSNAGRHEFNIPQMKNEVNIDAIFPKQKNAIDFYKNKTVDQVKQDYKNLEISGLDLKSMKIKAGESYDFNHDYLGEIHTDVVQMKRNGKDIDVHFAHAVNNNPNELFITNMVYSDAKINSFGIYDKQINAGPLTAKPIDYAEGMPGNNAWQVPLDANFTKYNGKYMDIRSLYQETPIIKYAKENILSDMLVNK